MVPFKKWTKDSGNLTSHQSYHHFLSNLSHFQTWESYTHSSLQPKISEMCISLQFKISNKFRIISTLTAAIQSRFGVKKKLKTLVPSLISFRYRVTGSLQRRKEPKKIEKSLKILIRCTFLQMRGMNFTYLSGLCLMQLSLHLGLL